MFPTKSNGLSVDSDVAGAPTAQKAAVQAAKDTQGQLARGLQNTLAPFKAARAAVFADPTATEADKAAAQSAYRSSADPAFSTFHQQKTAAEQAKTLAGRHARPTQGRAAALPIKMAKGGKIDLGQCKVSTTSRNKKNGNW